MISYIKGIVESVTSEKVIIDHNGMGYGIFMPLHAVESLGEGEEIKVHTYLNVREDAMQLFGFLTLDELEMFKLLIGVSGVGPKGALAIITALPDDELKMAIISDDAKAISKAQGIGAKTAQRVIIELKDKVDVAGMVADYQKVSASASLSDSQQEAIHALVSLGFSKTDSVNAIKQIKGSAEMSFDEIVTVALQTVF